MTFRVKIATALALVAALATSSSAFAQTSDELRGRRATSSGEYMSFEIGAGPYVPAARLEGSNEDGSAVERAFGDDSGPLLHIEIDGWAYRIPYVGLIGGGLSWGWANYSAGLCTGTDTDGNCSDRLSEETSLTLFPLAAMAVLRVDVLARELSLPIVLSGKIGPEMIFYNSSGGNEANNGRAFGLRWAAQLAVELDFINPRRSRSLDEEWGINHTTLYVEIFGSSASASGTATTTVDGVRETVTNSLDLGTRLGWTIGVGLHI